MELFRYLFIFFFLHEGKCRINSFVFSTMREDNHAVQDSIHYIVHVCTSVDLHRFLSGLKDLIRQSLVPLWIGDLVLVKRVRRVKIDLQITQKHRELHKKIIEESEHTT